MPVKKSYDCLEPPLSGYLSSTAFKEAKVGAVKLEGGLNMVNQVKAISQSGIPVFGHIGLTPQSSNSFGGYRIVGRTKNEQEKLLDDAKALEQAGVNPAGLR